MLDLKNRVAIVTGSVGNLGSAVAQAFRKHGAKLVVVDRAIDRLQATFPELVGSRDALFVGEVDLSKPESVTQMVDRTLDRFDRVDILINTVGGFRGGRLLHEADPTDWEAMFNVNVQTTVNTCRAVASQMIKQKSGRILNVASKAALHGAEGLSAYCASKAAVVRLTESLSEELGRFGVNVNCVLPGTIDTPQNRQAMPDADFSTWVTPEAIASVIAFLASDLAGAIHGAAIPVGL